MRFRSALLLATCVLGSCIRPGPDFQSLREPWIDHWDNEMLAQTSAMHVQPGNRQWRTQPGDPLLDRLIAYADAHNPDLRIRKVRMEAPVVGVAPEVAGRAIQVEVRNNKGVDAGQLLFELAP
ncbi:Biotin-lipoyl like [Azotobacter beijerinckii]|uniref:Biotin-lipoyl like n=1 Tax=Azotobacter beijerinckii TaxID=170623 RepID=A0A1H9RLP9_9GAMM|nr:biotin/lipoyl-binding protein [Azotobacter beijerinckii]SER73771.1 Biotin-lipoyl like [Azotobacter beijerinckii]